MYIYHAYLSVFYNTRMYVNETEIKKYQYFYGTEL